MRSFAEPEFGRAIVISFDADRTNATLGAAAEKKAGTAMTMVEVVLVAAGLLWLVLLGSELYITLYGGDDPVTVPLSLVLHSLCVLGVVAFGVWDLLSTARIG